MTHVILFVFGTIIGSFLNVVGIRWNSSVSLGGRSHCAVCSKQLRWWELIPVVSYFLLRGRCKGCRTHISWQYPLIELWTGLLFATLYYVAGFTYHFLLLAMVFCIYVVITIYDLRHKIIPDELVYISVLISALVPLVTADYTLLDWLAGPIIFLFFGTIWMLTRGRALGLGDAKLGVSIGLLLGAAHGFSAIMLAFWIGAAVTLGYMFFVKVSLLKSKKRLTMKSEIPFAPFMILGAWISLILELNLLHVV